MCHLCNSGLVEVWTAEARLSLARGDDVSRSDVRNTKRVACTCPAGEHWGALKVHRYNPDTMLRIDDTVDLREQAAGFVPQLGTEFDPSAFEYPGTYREPYKD